MRWHLGKAHLDVTHAGGCAGWLSSLVTWCSLWTPSLPGALHWIIWLNQVFPYYSSLFFIVSWRWCVIWFDWLYLLQLYKTHAWILTEISVIRSIFFFTHLSVWGRLFEPNCHCLILNVYCSFTLFGPLLTSWLPFLATSFLPLVRPLTGPSSMLASGFRCPASVKR